MLGGFSAYYGLLAAWFLGLTTALLAVHTGRLFPGLTGFGAARLVLGRLSFPVILVFLVFTLAFTALVTRNFTDFLQEIFFQVTPGPILGGAVLLVAAYQADRGIEGLARASQLLLPIGLGFLAVMYIAGMANVQPHFLTQHAPSLPAVIRSALGAFFLFLNVQSLHAVAPFVRCPHLGYRMVLLAFVILLLVIFLILVVSVGTFGLIGVQHTPYPSLSILKLIHWRGFLIEKTGLFAIGVWTVLVFMTLSIQLWVSSVGVVELLKLRSGRGPWVTTALAALVIVLSRVPRSAVQLPEYLASLTAVGLAMGLGFPILVHAVAWVRGLGRGRRNGPYGRGRREPPPGVWLWGRPHSSDTDPPGS